MPSHPGKNEMRDKDKSAAITSLSFGIVPPADRAKADALKAKREAGVTGTIGRSCPGAEGEELVTRAWAALEVKRAGDDEKRIIAGIASTPETDRMGDIVEPLGLEFKNPLPLLWQHQHDKPIGWAKMDKPTAKGLTFSAQLARLDEPGALSERLNEAWQLIKSGLVRGISIGFKSLERSFMDGGGIRFIRAEVVELSLVTVPANSQATIETIRSLDAASSAADGRKDDARKLPGAAGARKPEQQRAKAMPQTIADTIASFEGRRTTAQAAMKAIMEKSNEEGRTLDEKEKEEFDGHEAEVENINEHLVRLQKFEQQQREAAVPVKATDLATATQSRDVAAVASNGNGTTRNYPIVSVRPNCPPTTGFIRLCLAMMAGKGSREDSLRYVKKRVDWHSSTPELLQILGDDDVMYHLRAAVPAATTYDSSWAGPLVYAQNLTSAFAEYLRPMTIIGRFDTLRRVPFNVRIPRATGGTSGGWVGEAAPKPVSSMTLDTLTMTWAKAAVIVVLTEEVVRFSNPAAEDMVRTDMAAAITQFLDRQFVDPSVSAVTNVSPGSITQGITPITPTGTNLAAFRADVKTLMNQLLITNQSLAGGRWIMTQQQAMSLSLAQNSLGQVVFPTISADSGGTLLGYPVIASENIPATGGSPTDGYPLIFAIGPEILLADDGVVTVDASREASLQMDSAPDSPPTSGTNMLSLWQLNMLGLRAERWATWARRRSSAVAWIQNAKYGE